MLEINLNNNLSGIEFNLSVLSNFRYTLDNNYKNINLNIDNYQGDIELQEDLKFEYNSINYYLDKVIDDFKKLLTVKDNFCNIEAKDLDDYTEKFINFKQDIELIKSSLEDNKSTLLVKISLYNNIYNDINKILKLNNYIDIKAEASQACKEAKNCIDNVWPEEFINNNKVLTQLIIRAMDIYDKLVYHQTLIAKDEKASYNYYQFIEYLNEFYLLPDVVKQDFDNAEILSGIS